MKQLIQKTTRIGLSLILLAGLLAGFLALSGAPAAHAAGAIIVNSDSDAVANDGLCTLREAILNANNDDQSGSTDCAAGSGADTITFAGDYTILLEGQLPKVTSTVTINGNGEAETIVQSIGLWRILAVGNTGDLTINDITLKNGYAAGGGDPDNEDGGGIHNAGVLTVMHSTIADSEGYVGGGIYNAGTLMLAYSTLTGNDASEGGGIYNRGTLTIIASTFAGNTNTYSPNGGGAIANVLGNVTMTDSIFSDNGSILGGAIYNQNGTMDVAASTFSGNHAGVFRWWDFQRPRHLEYHKQHLFQQHVHQRGWRCHQSGGNLNDDQQHPLGQLKWFVRHKTHIRYSSAGHEHPEEHDHCQQHKRRRLHQS
jgi:CSLREA domain-containing protein